MFIITVVIMALVALAVVGIVLLVKYHKYTEYSLTSVIEMSNTEENTRFYLYGDGYLKCASDGVTYFNENRILWNEDYSMLQPVSDICGDYIAVADVGQKTVYLYDRSGFVNKISVSSKIVDVEVTRAGVVAAVVNEDQISKLEIKDRNGDEIMSSKSIFSSNGYLMDVDLSDDGQKMAAIYINVDKGTLKSKVVFYDLSNGENAEKINNWVFNQYESVLLTNIRFLENNNVCVVGDTALSFYKFGNTPELVYEELERQSIIQVLMFNDRYVGMISDDPDTETTYTIKVYDSTGNTVLEKGTDFSLTKAVFAGENVMMYAGNECLMYSFDGIEKYHGALEERIEGLASKDGKKFVYGTNCDTRFIVLK